MWWLSADVGESNLCFDESPIVSVKKNGFVGFELYISPMISDTFSLG